MRDMNEIVEIRYVGGLTYRIRFDDGAEGDVELSSYLNRGPVFQSFRDPEFFRQARIEGGTLAWPGDVDIAPETLYEMVTAKVR